MSHHTYADEMLNLSGKGRRKKKKKKRLKTYLVDFTIDEPQCDQIEVLAINKREARMKAKEEIEDQTALNYGIVCIREMEPEVYDEN